MTILLGAALGSAIAIGVLLGYAPIHRKVLNFHYSPRLIWCWLLPIIDVVVTITLIGGAWFGVGKAMGIQMTMFSIWTAIGLSATVFAIRKLLIKRWRSQFEQAKKFSSKQTKKLIRC